MIKVNKVVKAFGSKKALDDLNMRVHRGEVYGLVGPNGAGKTTILQHLSGAMRQDSGELAVCGQPVFENMDVKSKVAYIPSDFYYYNQATIADMRDLHASLFKGFDKNRFTQLKDIFEMDEKLQVRSLSKGMKKQVAFWLALSQRAELLLLDEPVDGLDPNARHKVWGVVMDEVAQRGMTVVTSSHNLRELSDVCDHVGIMENGRMHLERSLVDLQDNFVKAQVAFADDQLQLPRGFDVLNQERQGRLYTLVVKGNAEQVERAFGVFNPVFVNILPLSLEEIFIYELGGGKHVCITD